MGKLAIIASLGNESFNLASFAPLLGDRFQLVLGGSEIVDLILVEADGGRRGSDADADGAGRPPFSLVFRGPLEPVLPQRIYGFRNETLGSFELFIVPIGPAGEAMQYQAVFG